MSPSIQTDVLGSVWERCLISAKRRRVACCIIRRLWMKKYNSTVIHMSINPSVRVTQKNKNDKHIENTICAFLSSWLLASGFPVTYWNSLSALNVRIPVKPEATTRKIISPARAVRFRRDSGRNCDRRCRNASRCWNTKPCFCHFKLLAGC